ncbi:hypothetical protein HYX06_06475 [Candidatus Woesearchaeota archaeon]|nr:hypothetical protein [Candidatus Woesearchaeota archaeon]
MSSDVVIPKNNEAEFIEIAAKLGIKKMHFLYDFDGYNEEKAKKKLDSIDNKKISIEIGFLINQKNLNKAAKISRFLTAKSSDKDRFFIESKKVKIIYGFEESGRNDFMHQRASGLNHILCELARKNNVSIGFSYSSIINNKTPAVIIGRMMQNIILCKKYKVNTIFASFSSNPFELRQPHDILSLFRLLGY